MGFAWKKFKLKKPGTLEPFAPDYPFDLRLLGAAYGRVVRRACFMKERETGKIYLIAEFEDGKTDYQDTSFS